MTSLYVSQDQIKALVFTLPFPDPRELTLSSIISLGLDANLSASSKPFRQLATPHYGWMRRPRLPSEQGKFYHSRQNTPPNSAQRNGFAEFDVDLDDKSGD
jgi:hypothetical protein